MNNRVNLGLGGGGGGGGVVSCLPLCPDLDHGHLSSLLFE